MYLGIKALASSGVSGHRFARDASSNLCNFFCMSKLKNRKAEQCKQSSNDQYQWQRWIVNTNDFCNWNFNRWTTGLGQCCDWAVGWTTNKSGFNSWQGQRVVSPDWLLGTSSLLSMGNGVCYLEVKKLRNKADHLSPSSAKVKYVWSNTSIPTGLQDMVLRYTQKLLYLTLHMNNCAKYWKNNFTIV